MDYTKIRDLLNERRIKDIDVEIVSCVNSSVEGITDEEYELICSYTYGCWSMMNNTYIQLLTDIICDLYQDLGYGYRDEDKFLSFVDLKNGDKKELVLDLFYINYNNY